MSFNSDFLINIPKIILTSKKDNKYKFLSSRQKIYRIKNIIIIGKIVIIPEYINKNINKNSYIENTNNIIFNEEKFNIIKYLIENKVINNYYLNETIESMKNKFKLYKFFSKNNKSYWKNKTKNILMDIYKTESIKLGLEPKIFFTKKELLEYCFTNPLIDHFYTHNNKYFISNSSKSNMEEGLSLSPTNNISLYECIFNMFSVPIQDESYDEISYYFKKFRNDNIIFIINEINVLTKPFNKYNLYRLIIFMLEDGLEEIFGSNKENAAKIIQKNWRNWKNRK
jgi:hypothetical protein